MRSVSHPSALNLFTNEHRPLPYALLDISAIYLDENIRRQQLRNERKYYDLACLKVKQMAVSIENGYALTVLSNFIKPKHPLHQSK